MFVIEKLVIVKQETFTGVKIYIIQGNKLFGIILLFAFSLIPAVICKYAPWYKKSSKVFSHCKNVSVILLLVIICMHCLWLSLFNHNTVLRYLLQLKFYKSISSWMCIIAPS